MQTTTRSQGCLDKSYGRVGVRWLDAASIIVIAVCFWIGQLQSGGTHSSWLTSYGGDILGAFYLQWMILRLLLPCREDGPWLASLITLAGCFAWEFSQLKDFSGSPLAVTKGTFDLWDLAAYGVGVSLGYGSQRGLAALHKWRTLQPEGPS